jgi:tetratricopeptide (TPR) repeat protein
MRDPQWLYGGILVAAATAMGAATLTARAQVAMDGDRVTALEAVYIVASPESVYVASGDSAYAALDAVTALADYEKALAVDSADYDALCKASRVASDLAEFERDEARRTAFFTEAGSYAARAIAVKPTDAEGHFHRARALGLAALSVGSRARIKYGKEVRAEALAALQYAPDHPGALHVLGVWNAEVMRLSGIERFIAKNLLGGGVLSAASWHDAITDLERAVAVDPDRIVHHLDLAKVYLDTHDKAKAKEQLEIVAAAPIREYNDPHYKEDAARRLATLDK